MRTITVVEYDPKWPALFEAEAERIRTALQPFLTALHHIGSTAVPGLAAKPTVDLLGETTSLDAIDGCTEKMDAIGYTAHGENGIALRRFFTRTAGGLRTHHLHLFPEGHAEVLRHLRFRDYLRVHHERAKAYEQLKRKLAQEFMHDAEAYSAGKNTLIRQLDAEAAEWASRNGF